MILELVDRRVLGVVRFFDAATQSTVTDGLSVDTPGADLRRNRSGLWVIWGVPGLEAHTEAFEQPPSTPNLESLSFTLAVSDSAGRYVKRSATVHVPLDPAPAMAAPPGSLFRPVDVALYPSATARVLAGWALIRARVINTATSQPLAGALVRVLTAPGGAVMARGMSDERGEALVAAPGIPVMTPNPGAGPALATEVDVKVEAIFDPAAGAVTDPDAVESKSGLPSTALDAKLAAGKTLVIELAVTVP